MAQIGDRQYFVPEVIPISVPAKDWDDDIGITGELVIVDGQPRFRRITLEFTQPMTPLQVQRVKWAHLVEGTIAEIAIDPSDVVVPTPLAYRASGGRR